MHALYALQGLDALTADEVAAALKDLVERLGLRIVENVSPKLLLEKDPALHAPLVETR